MERLATAALLLLRLLGEVKGDVVVLDLIRRHLRDDVLGDLLESAVDVDR